MPEESFANAGGFWTQAEWAEWCNNLAARFEARAHEHYHAADEAAGDPERGWEESRRLETIGDRYGAAADLIREEIDQ